MTRYARMFVQMGFLGIAYDFYGGGFTVRSDGRVSSEDTKNSQELLALALDEC